MEKVIMLPLLALSLGLLSGTHGSDPQEYCHGMPCPDYTVVQQHEGFEERLYVETTWITSRVPEGPDGVIWGFSRLKAYCQGENEDGTAVSKDTWPALITIEREDGTAKHLNVSWFVIPGATLPKPTNPLVVRECRRAATVYVRCFGGKANLADGVANEQLLRQSLAQAGKSFVAHTSIGVGYDSPFDIFHSHHNEVWVYAE